MCDLAKGRAGAADRAVPGREFRWVAPVVIGATHAPRRGWSARGEIGNQPSCPWLRTPRIASCAELERQASDRTSAYPVDTSMSPGDTPARGMGAADSPPFCSAGCRVTVGVPFSSYTPGPVGSSPTRSGSDEAKVRPLPSRPVALAACTYPRLGLQSSAISSHARALGQI
jgi:hypothetical protein